MSRHLSLTSEALSLIVYLEFEEVFVLLAVPIFGQGTFL